MEARRKRFEDLDISRDEINNIGKALQKEEFRKLFVDYCQEVTSPQNKELFQREVTELEKQRGIDVTFINPEPGFVVKTSVDGIRKAFINICKNENVCRPSSCPASQEGTSGLQWSLPFSLAPPREDLDRQKNRCSVFDVVFHPEVHTLSEKGPDFRRMLIDTALDAVENNCHVSLDRANLKFPKLAYKGLQQAAVIRKKIENHEASKDDQELLNSIPYPPEDSTWTELQKQKKPKSERASASADCTAPKYVIKYRHDIDMGDFTNDATSRLNVTVPKELVIQIDLPLLKSANDVLLDVTTKSLSLVSKKPKYKLDLVLPYGVDEDSGRATFDAAKRILSLVLPVKRSNPSSFDGGREDSGVESDLGNRPDEESDDKTPSENSDEGCDGNDVHLIQEIHPQNDATYRTNSLDKSNCDKFLNNDVQYLLPNFTCNAYENMIAFTLHVKNVDESSVCHQIILDSQGMQLSFCSLGGGLFPQHYGLCIVFPDGIYLDENSMGVEVWDNNVVVQVKLKELLQPVSELSVGTGLHDLQIQDFPNLAHVEKLFSQLQVDCSTPQNCPPVVDVLSAKPDEVILTVEPNSQSEKAEDNIDSCNEPNPDINSDKLSTQISSIGVARNNRKANIRQLSECSSDDINRMKIRGILKKRPVRSLSESNAEEYAWLNRSISDDGESMGLSSALGSELCVADEGSEAGCETENDSGDRQTKKTVRFNDVIAKQTFRPNSSILGQRKKNQRKQRNKKRAQERRASESENSEAEPDIGKARRRGSLPNECTDPDWKYNKNMFIKMKNDASVSIDKPVSKPILRRAPSSDTDEDAIRDIKCPTENPCDPVVEDENPGKTEPACPGVGNGESSEDERDTKTEDCKKKKKRRGKKVAEGVSQNQLPHISSCQEGPQFSSALMVDLE